METDVEINCLRLSGSKAPHAQRPKNHKSNRQRSTDSNSKDKHFNVYLSTRMMERPATPPNSPLVMQMYNHKKSRESVLKRVQEQTQRVKKKRLVYLKTTSSLEPNPVREPETVKTKQASPRHSHYSDSVLSSSVRTLPRIDANNNSLTGCHKYNNDIMNSVRERRYKNEINQQNTQQILQERDALVRKSERKIEFDITENYANNDHNEADDNIERDNVINDDNSDNESIDSLAIQSIFVNNCNHDNTSNKYVSPWSHRRIPKNISWSPLQESYKGYLYKTNGDIVLTRKYQPPSHPSPSTKVKSEPIGRHKAYNKTYRWGYMDPGRILNKQITALSITGTHA